MKRQMDRERELGKMKKEKRENSVGLQRMLVRLDRVLRHWLVLASTTTRP